MTLPSGTVTLLLADVEGSTRMWETSSDQARSAMSELDALVDELVAKFDGARPVEQGEGDSFVAAFSRPSDAVACALEMQKRLVDGAFRVRMALHTGEIEIREGSRYDGPTIIRAARVRDLGHGGQTLLSATTHDLVQDVAPDDAGFIDLGSHRLKSLDRPERVYQLVHPALENQFPPLRSTDVARGKLPAQLTSFVGRAKELDDVRALLAGNRLLTLTGAGGCGKTRLAVEVADRVQDEFDDGVWFCDLGPLADPDGVAAALCTTLGAKTDHKTDIDVACARIGDGQMLVVLDNCEHLIEACATLADALLRRCPRVTVLTTSREPLGVESELAWRVPSLPSPARGETIAPEDAARFDAVALFVQRATQARPTFALTPDNATAVAEVCARLEGIPLAIELAAARVRTLSVQQIASGLNDRFRLLGRGARTLLPRQQTLEASVGWSHDLLSEQQRVVLRRLAVFAGGFSLEGAEAVVSADDVGTPEVLDLVSQLVDRSLVLAEETSNGTRYRMLETIRQFARERLVESGEAPDVARRHLSWCTGLVARTVGTILIAQQDSGRALLIIDEEYDNIRAAVEWALSDERSQEGLVLVSFLTFAVLVTYASRVREIRRWLTELLSQGAGVDDRIRASGVVALAWATAFLWESWDDARAHAEEGLALAEACGDRRVARMARVLIGQALATDASPEAASYFEALEVEAREDGDPYVLGLAVNGRVMAAYFAGDVRETIRLAEGAIDAIGDSALALVGFYYGSALCVHGDLEQSRAFVEDAHARFIAQGNLYWSALAFMTLGGIETARGDFVEGSRLTARAVDLVTELGFDVHIAWYSTWRAWFTLSHGDVDDAERMLDATAQLSKDVAPRLERLPGVLDRTVEAVRSTAWALIRLVRGDVEGARALIGPAMEASLSGALFTVSCTAAAVIVLRTAGEIDAADSLNNDDLDGIARRGAFIVAPHALDLAGALRADVGADADAVRLMAAASAAYARMDVAPLSDLFFDRQRELAALRERLGDDAYNDAWAEGESLSLDDAIAFALRGRGPRQRPRAGWDALTPTERKVVELVAEGLSNPQIAERLLISKRTVSTHVSHVFAKTGVSSRAELAAEATKRSVN